MPSYQFNWHHNEVISELEDFVLGDQDRLIITFPPRHGKSELVSRRLPAWIFGINPSAQIIATSYSQDLASDMNRDVQSIMISDEYNAVFPDSSLVNEVKSIQAYQRNSKKFHIINNSGYYVCAGVGGPITGKGCHFGIIDDPVKNREEASSKTYRDKQWKWFTSTFYSRLEKGGKILITLTRWNEDDIVGRLLKLQKEDPDAEQWRVVNMPAIKDETGGYEYDNREIGEALWPEKYDVDRLKRIKATVGELDWNSLYQQRPAPLKGNIIKTRWFPISDRKFNYIPNYYLDSAYTDNTKNDPSCLMEYIHIGEKVQITNVWRMWLEAPELLKELKKIITNPHSRLTIEPKASGKTIAQMLKKETDILVTEDVAPSDSKVTRCKSVTPFMERGQVEVLEAHWNDAFFSECKVFPNGSHDDQVDCLVGIIRIAFASIYYNDDDTRGFPAFGDELW